MEALQISPIPFSKVHDKKIIHKKIEEIGDATRKKLGTEKPDKSNGEKVIQQFVSEYEDLGSSDKFRVLTAMPRDMNREELQGLFGVSERTARRAIEVQREKGLLSTPNPKPGKRIPPRNC